MHASCVKKFPECCSFYFVRYLPYNPLDSFRCSFERGTPDQFEFNMAGVLFEDIFDVKDIDPEGKKFDRG